MAGHVSVSRVTFSSTRQHLPQPLAGTQSLDHCSYSRERRGSNDSVESSPASESSQLQARKKMSLLPGSKSARTVAGKAGRAATKGATKMASAFKKLGRKNSASKRLGQEDPEIIGAVEESADLLNLEGIIDGALDNSCDVEGAWENASGSGEAAGMQRCPMYSPNSTPSTDRPGTPERQERSDFSSGSDLHNTSSSDSDAAGHSRAKKAPVREAPASTRDTLRPARDSDVWDAQAYGKVRPLECSSIWDIPTSRIPEPPPRPPAPRASSGQGQSRHLPQIKVAVASNSESADTENAMARYRCRQKNRIAVLLCLAAVLLTVSLAAALHW